MAVGRYRRVLVAVIAAAALAACLALPGAAAAEDWVYQLPSYKEPGFDRSFKADLVEQLPYAPQLVFLGGSRAVRFEPAYAQKLTGLQGFNAAFLVGRHTDSWGFLNYLLERSPDTKLRCIWFVQAGSFGKKTLHPAMIDDDRFTPYFDQAYLDKQKALAWPYPINNLLSGRRFGWDGVTLWNDYDRREASGTSLDQVLTQYLRSLLPVAAKPSVMDTTAKRYFKKRLALLNRHGVVPLVVIMPYHPRVLRAFLSVGWGTKLTALKTYLRGLRETYDFRILDYHDIRSFNGRADWFYDGAHIKVGNARRIIAHAVKDRPSSFRD